MDNKAESTSNYRTLRLPRKNCRTLQSRRRENESDLTLTLEKLIISSQFMSPETKEWLLMGLRKR